MGNDNLYQISSNKIDYNIIVAITLIMSIFFLFSVLFGKSTWTRVIGIILSPLLLVVSILTYKVTKNMQDFVISKDGITCTFVKAESEKIIKAEHITKLIIFHVMINMSELKINDEYYVLSIDTEQKNYRYLPLEFHVTKKNPVDIKSLINALNNMGHKVEIKEIIIDKTPEKRHLFDPEYPEKFGDII